MLDERRLGRGRRSVTSKERIRALGRRTMRSTLDYITERGRALIGAIEPRLTTLRMIAGSGGNWLLRHSGEERRSTPGVDAWLFIGLGSLWRLLAPAGRDPVDWSPEPGGGHPSSGVRPAGASTRLWPWHLAHWRPQGPFLPGGWLFGMASNRNCCGRSSARLGGRWRARSGALWERTGWTRC